MHIIVRQISLHIYAAFIVFSYFTSSIFSLAQTPNGNLTYFTEQCIRHDRKSVPLLHEKIELITKTHHTSNFDLL